MSGATNDTTRIAADVWAAKVALGLARGNPSLLTKRDVSDILRVVESLEADLERLAGPPCDYPPCKGARAVEHAMAVISSRIGLRSSGCAFRHHVSGLCGRQEIGHDAAVYRAREPSHSFDGVSNEYHPPSPAIEAWLRERGK